MVTPEERQWMWEQYAPEPRMRLNQGIRRRLAPLLDNDRRKIELANSLLFTLPGSPIIYYGDEIGLGDNVWLDDRNGVRTPMQWDDNPTAGFTKAQPFAPVLDRDYSPKHVNVAAQIADPDSLFSAIRRMISIHKKHQAFGWGSFEWIDAGSNAIAAYERMHVDETMLILNNLSDRQQTIYLDKGRAVNAFTGENVSLGSLTIKPFEYLWFTLKS